MAAVSRASLHPTVLGIKGALLFAALELAFLATSYSNLFFLLLTFCAALGAGGAFWAYRNLRGLSVAGVDIAAGPAGHARPLAVTVVGAASPRYDVAVQLLLSTGCTEVAHACRLAEPTTLHGELPALPRGIETPGRVCLSSSFPFGLFRARRDVLCAVEIVTHPDPRAADAGGGSPQRGDGALVCTGRGSAIAGLRALRPGDAVADVHWKATARRDTPIVKERERDASAGATVVLDRRCPATALEPALQTVAGLVVAARHRHRLRLVSQGAELAVDAERGGAEAALRWLAGTQPLPADAAAPPAITGALRLPDPARGPRDG